MAAGSDSESFSFQAMLFTVVPFPAYVFAATLTNSTAILTDVLATVVDVFVLTACWLVLRLANRAHAGKYAYGLGKLENLTELFIALLQAILVIYAGMTAIGRLQAPQAVSGAEVGLALMVLDMVGDLYLSRKAARLAEATRSPVLSALSRVHLISATSSGLVFTGTSLQLIFPEHQDLRYLDPIGSFIVIGIMIYSAYAMLTNSVGSLLDQAIDEAGQLRILRVLTQHFHDYSELSDIRTRQLGGKMFVELHLGFEDDWTVAQTRIVVARITESVKSAFREAGDEVDVAVVLIPAVTAAAAGDEAVMGEKEHSEPAPAEGGLLKA